MDMFETIEDVEDWLEPMNFEQFWRELRPFCLVLPSRRSCEADIAAGAALEDVLIGVKGIAAYELIKRHDLQCRPVGPVLRVIGAKD